MHFRITVLVIFFLKILYYLLFIRDFPLKINIRWIYFEQRYSKYLGNYIISVRIKHKSINLYLCKLGTFIGFFYSLINNIISLSSIDNIWVICSQHFRANIFTMLNVTMQDSRGRRPAWRVLHDHQEHILWI